MSVAPPGAPPAPGTVACPRCGASIGPDQDWCLDCGAPARTRLVPTPNWRAPVAVLAVVVRARRHRPGGGLRRADQRHRARRAGQLAGAAAVGHDGQPPAAAQPAPTQAAPAPTDRGPGHRRTGGRPARGTGTGEHRPPPAPPPARAAPRPRARPASGALDRQAHHRRASTRQRPTCGTPLGLAADDARPAASPRRVPTSGQRSASRPAACAASGCSVTAGRVRRLLGADHLERRHRRLGQRLEVVAALEHDAERHVELVGQRRACSPPSARSPRGVTRQPASGSRTCASKPAESRIRPGRYSRPSEHDDVLDERAPRRVARPGRHGRLTV